MFLLHIDMIYKNIGNIGNLKNLIKLHYIATEERNNMSAGTILLRSLIIWLLRTDRPDQYSKPSNPKKSRIVKFDWRKELLVILPA